MEACHLLLGKPLQFDRNGLHHGMSNTYLFKMRSGKWALMPLTPTRLHRTKPGMENTRQKALFASGNRGERAISKGKTIFCVLVVEAHTSEEMIDLNPPSITLVP